MKCHLKIGVLISFVLFLVLIAVAVTSCRNGGPGSETAADTAAETDGPGSETVVDTAAETGGGASDPALTGWFDYGSALYLRDDFTPGTMADGISFQMAQNEKEGFQYILTSSADVSDLRCELEPLSDGAGHTLTGEVNVVWYLWIQKADTVHEAMTFAPCMMLPQDDPYQGGTFDVASGTARTLFVRFETDKDTVPGTYTGMLTITKDGKTKLTGNISVRVRDVYYDEETECMTHIGLGYDPGDPNDALKPGPDSAPELGGGSDLQRIYAQFLLDNRMTPSSIPYSGGLENEEALAYLKNPRVTLTALPSWNNLDEQYRIALENGVAGKIVFGYFDEPHIEGHMNVILHYTRQLKEKYPAFREMDACYIDLQKDGRNIIERLSEVTDIYCVKTSFFTGVIRDTMLRLKAERGDTLLWYVCGAAEYNTINLLPCTPGVDKRTLFWQHYQQDVDGFLYWRVTFWNDGANTKYTTDVWADDYLTAKRTFPKGSEAPTDDGVLLYWHPQTGLPVSTLGFESVRDGIEDFQLMRMAEAVDGRDKVLSYVEQITTDPTDFIRYEDGSAPLLESLKNQLFDLVEGK